MMELATLLQTLADNGFGLGLSGCTANAVQVQGPMDRLTPGLRDALRQHKPALLSLLASPPDLEAEAERQAEREAIQREAEAPEEATAFPFGANLPDWWDLLTEADRKGLQTKRERQGPCYFCGGRNHHHPDCCGVSLMPWGQHRGEPLSDIPDGYLRFIVSQAVGSDEHKHMLRAEWQRRYDT